MAIARSIVRHTFSEAQICSMTGLKYFESKTENQKPSALLFFMPGYGLCPSNFSYFFKGKHYEKLGGVDTYALASSYTNPDNFNEVMTEKDVFKTYQDFIAAKS